MIGKVQFRFLDPILARKYDSDGMASALVTVVEHHHCHGKETSPPGCSPGSRFLPAKPSHDCHFASARSECDEKKEEPRGCQCPCQCPCECDSQCDSHCQPWTNPPPHGKFEATSSSSKPNFHSSRFTLVVPNNVLDRIRQTLLTIMTFECTDAREKAEVVPLLAATASFRCELPEPNPNPYSYSYSNSNPYSNPKSQSNSNANPHPNSHSKISNSKSKQTAKAETCSDTNATGQPKSIAGWFGTVLNTIELTTAEDVRRILFGLDPGRDWKIWIDTTASSPAGRNGSGSGARTSTSTSRNPASPLLSPTLSTGQGWSQSLNGEAGGLHRHLSGTQPQTTNASSVTGTSASSLSFTASATATAAASRARSPSSVTSLVTEYDYSDGGVDSEIAKNQTGGQGDAATRTIPTHAVPLHTAREECAGSRAARIGFDDCELDCNCHCHCYLNDLDSDSDFDSEDDGLLWELLGAHCDSDRDADVQYLCGASDPQSSGTDGHDSLLLPSFFETQTSLSAVSTTPATNHHPHPAAARKRKMMPPRSGSFVGTDATRSTGRRPRMGGAGAGAGGSAASIQSQADGPVALDSSSLLQGSELEMAHILESVLGSLLVPEEPRDVTPAASAASENGNRSPSGPRFPVSFGQGRCECNCECDSDPRRFPLPTPRELLPPMSWNYRGEDPYLSGFVASDAGRTKNSNSNGLRVELQWWTL
eukprot:CAMPEP_0172358444 /NCGR_PEP_ID=MMETSP1060-20121228/2754_1 /TAXON_ID=37318 /ORGANISM="Pseudo-nitzschia pungens, Strain cf. cingulata" /LENGTH=707 /DNA_ID=CAMNT_0013079655 /DNA_START=56 /DNA_END=2179 /DNA_ORIENTATION=+